MLHFFFATSLRKLKALDSPWCSSKDVVPACASLLGQPRCGCYSETDILVHPVSSPDSYL